ncbi:MAG: hypothetical protein WBX25_14745 [Rhodomicrobium sp.]
MTRLLKNCGARLKETGEVRSLIEFRISGVSAQLSVEALRLFGEHEGLVVAEATRQEPAKPTKLAKRKTAQKTDNIIAGHHPKPVRKDGERRERNARPVPQLSHDEMRSFKAIGRKVNRLCRERRPTAPLLPATSLYPQARAKPAPPLSDGAHEILTSAFDLVLLLDARLIAIASEGRSQPFGWRKGFLNGKPAAGLFARSEQAVFQQMARKVTAGEFQYSKEALLALSEDGSCLPCRAVFGRADRDGCAFFLALLTLELTPRLKSLKTQTVTPDRTRGLAA